MPRGVHFTAQTAFRLPEGLLASLKGAAAEDERTMTDCVSEAIGEWLDRRNGITTRVTTVPEPAAAVSPPRARKPREDTAPRATFKSPEPSRRAHAVNCKCGMCKPTKGS